MPLDFTSIYLLSDVNGNFMKAQQIAMAPRKVSVSDPETNHDYDEWQFLVPTETNLGHTIDGTVKKDEGGVVEIQDNRREGNDGKPVLWRFEPLTLEAWNKMGERGDIDGWEELKDQMKNDADLIHFYRHDWLLSRLEWWKQKPE